MQRINSNLYPKDGYFFRESDDSVHRAKNWREVIAKVTEYRKLKGLAPGKVLQEVMAQACQRNPRLCHEEPAANRPKPPVPLKARVLQWLSGLNKHTDSGPINQVAPDAAKVRADVCAACPANKALGVNSCAACKQAVEGYRVNIFRGKVRFDGRLGGCTILGTDLASFVNLDQDRIDNEALPAHCWTKIVRPT
jgi:hypothetical protein